MNDYCIEGHTIREHLNMLSAHANKKFVQSLHPGIENVLGLKNLDIRSLAIKISKDDWRKFLENADIFYMEERMLIGMVIANVKVDDTDEYLALVDKFVKIINSWSVCDTFDFKGKERFVKKNKEKIWDFLNHYMNSDREYEIRFGVVMAQAYFIDDEYVKKYLDKLVAIKNDAYYVRMGIAWALSTCYIKYPKVTLPYLKNNSLDNDLLKKTIQKICDSYRVPDEDKTMLRELRAQLK